MRPDCDEQRVQSWQPDKLLELKLWSEMNGYEVRIAINILSLI